VLFDLGMLRRQPVGPVAAVVLLLIAIFSAANAACTLAADAEVRRQRRNRNERQSGKSPASAMAAAGVVGLSTAVALAAVLFSSGLARAQDATWNGPSGDWNTGINWSTGSVPTGTATFTAAPSATVTFFNPISIGEIQFKAGAGPVTFNLEFGDFLTITGVGIANNSASAQSFNNSLSGGLVFENSSTAGSVTITNNIAGSTVFENNSTAGNARITNNLSGLTDFQDSSTAGNATITNNAAASTQFSNSSTAGSATITNNTGGKTFFADTSTAGNATIINEGGQTFFVNNSTAGAARLINNGGGTFDFSASTGLKSNKAISAGSIEGDGVFYLGANQLTVGSNNLSTTVSGVISACGAGSACMATGSIGGSLVKTGSGTLTLTAIDTYTGATVVNGGTLEVDGSTAKSVLTTVNAGGTLDGNGIVGNTQINAGGIFAPGNGTPGSSMTVAGNLAFQSGGIYLVQLNSATSSLANVTGTAALAGTVRASSATGSYRFNSSYTILTSAGLNGTRFDGLAAPVGIAGSLVYTANNVLLNLTSALGQIAGLNNNQRAVGAALDTAFNALGSNSAALSPIFSGNVPQNLTQASGELATATQQTTFDAMNLFMGLMTDPFVAGRGGLSAGGGGATGYADADALGYAAKRNPNDALAAIYTKAPRVAPYEPRWSTWVAGYGGSQNTDGNAAVGSNNTTSAIAGTAFGADYRFSPFTIAGFALAGGGTSFSVNGSGSGHSDLFQVGAFLRHDVGPAYISASLAYGWQDITTNRTLTVAGADQLHAEFNANAFSGRLEGGYRFVTPYLGGLGITPYAAGQFTTFDLPSYAESVLSGSSAFALGYGSQSVTDARSELGIRTDKSFAVQGGIFTLRSRFAWAHDYDPDRAVAATFQALPGASFVVNGVAQASDSALTTASAEMKWTNNWSVAATFEGEFSDVTRSYAGKGVVRYAW
jgi:autotransporter-associated beta strand protein